MRWRQIGPIVLCACILLLFAVLVLPATAQTSQDDNVGFSRFAHTAVDVGPLDIYVGDNPQLVVANLKYGDVTDFIALPTTLSGYTARAAGSPTTDKPLFQLQWGVKGNKSEMIIASGLDSRKAFILEPLTLVRNDTKGKARVHVLNMVWGGPTLSVGTTQGTSFSQNQEYIKPSAYTDVAPGTYDFEVKDSSGKTVTTTPGMKLEANKLYTLLITGGAEGNPPIKLLSVVSDQESTRVKLVNQSSSAYDVYVKGETSPFVTGLANGASTDFIALPSGAVTLVLRKAGTTSSDQEIAAVATQLRPGRDAVITVNSAGAKAQMDVTSETLTAAATGTMQATQAAPMQGTPEETPAG